MVTLLAIVFALVLAGVLAPIGVRAARDRMNPAPDRRQATLAAQAATAASVASVAHAALPYYAKAFYAAGPQDGYLLPPAATATAAKSR